MDTFVLPFHGNNKPPDISCDDLTSLKFSFWEENKKQQKKTTLYTSFT